MFPLTLSVLLWLQEDSMEVCCYIWYEWQESPLSKLEANETLHVRCFMQELAQELARVRLVLQICGKLMHGARVLYVEHSSNSSEYCLHLEEDFVSFSAHDSRNEMVFSTDCQSFMRILDQALVSQEINADYQRCTGLAREADDLRVWHSECEANVLADYVIACSVHTVQDVAQMC